MGRSSRSEATPSIIAQTREPATRRKTYIFMCGLQRNVWVQRCIQMFWMQNDSILFQGMSKVSLERRTQERRKVFAMAYSATSDDQLPLDRTDRILARQQLSDRILARQQRGMRYSQKGDLDAAEADFRSIIEVERCYTITNFSNLEG